MTLKLNALSCIVWTFVIALLAPGCMDDPNPVGFGLLPKDDTAVVDTSTVYATSHSSSRSLVLTTGVTPMMVGKYGSYESWGYLRFDIPSELSGATITGATLQLRASYAFGDTLAPLSFTVYKAVGGYTADSLTFDSLSQRPSDYFDNAAVVGSLPSQTLADTTIVQLSLDTAVVSSWFINALDSSNQGIYLRPTNSNVIMGFSSFGDVNPDYRPKLIVNYTQTGLAGSAVDSSGRSKFMGNISQSALVQDPQFMYVQNGVAFHGFATFNVAPVPFPSAIHKAELVLTLDTLKSSPMGKFTQDALFASFLRADGTVEVTSPAQQFNTTGRPVYRFLINGFIEQWTRYGTPPTLTIAGYTERTSFDRFVFYGSQADSSRRPRILVTYSVVR